MAGAQEADDVSVPGTHLMVPVWLAFVVVVVVVLRALRLEHGRLTTVVGAQPPVG